MPLCPHPYAQRWQRQQLGRIQWAHSARLLGTRPGTSNPGTKTPLMSFWRNLTVQDNNWGNNADTIVSVAVHCINTGEPDVNTHVPTTVKVTVVLILRWYQFVHNTAQGYNCWSYSHPILKWFYFQSGRLSWAALRRDFLLVTVYG